VGRVPCVNLDFIAGGEAIWSFKFFESGRWLVCDCRGGGGGNLWKPPVRTKRRRRKGVVFSLSIVGLATELRRSGDAIIQAALESVFAKSEAAFQHKTEAKWTAIRPSNKLVTCIRTPLFRGFRSHQVPKALVPALTDEY